jgi:hypothetical protein
MSSYTVDVYFKAFGIYARETYTVQASSAKQAEARAYGELEADLIDEGAATHDCTCCLLPAHVGGDVDSVETKVVP